MSYLPPLRLTGATILHGGELRDRPLAFAEGRIEGDAPHPEVDLSGYLVLPGIVDLHGDGFERHMAPRPTAALQPAQGFASFDREAAAHGVTTAFMAQSWSWEGAQRGPERAEEMLAALDAYRPRALTDLRVQIRAETHMVDEDARLIAAVERYGVGYVVFNDHLEEGIAMARAAPDRFADWAAKIGRKPEALRASIDAAMAAGPRVPRSLCRLAEAFERLGVIYGSHDDPDVETRERFRMLGATVAEFPLTGAVAEAARTMQGPVVLGAPNVVRGRSQAGNATASDIVAAGFCDALVSDYHVPALPLAAWRLVDRGILDLPRAWALISSGPAGILRLKDRGRLEAGRRADLVVVHSETRAIEATIVAGRLSHLSGEAARRFLALERTRMHSNGAQVAAE